MEMTGEQRIAAPRERVWAALNDPDVLRQAIDGCETLERDGDDGFTATVVARIGPVKARFGGTIRLTDLDPPRGYTLVGEGNGAGAGFARGQAKVSLTDEGGSTLLSYAVKADIGGKLAQIGSRLIDSAAKKQADHFFTRFAAQLQTEAAPAGTAPARTVPHAPSAAIAPVVIRVGPGWAGTIVMIAMALIIGFLAGRLWG